MTDYQIYCVSAGRPRNVPKVSKIFGSDVTWVVPHDEAQDYRAYGAVRFISQTEGKVAVARNLALEDAFSQDKACVQTDDDPTYLKIKERDSSVRDASPHEFIAEWLKLSVNSPAKLYGPGQANTFFSRWTVRQDVFISGEMWLCLPTHLRFDPTLAVCEDVDFCVQHLDTYGEVARVEWQSIKYAHLRNKGGCQRYRTPELEGSINARLVARWPKYLRLHPKRPHTLQIKRKREWM